MVNVHFTYTSPDSGLGGNNWANDTINRQAADLHGRWWLLRVYYRPGQFRHGRRDEPGKHGSSFGWDHRQMKGGYTTTLLTGTLNSSMPTRGDLGSSFTADNRPSFRDYGLIGDLAAWGWSYQTASNGSWVNAANPPSNAGDITG